MLNIKREVSLTIANSIADLLDEVIADQNPKMGGGAMTVSYYDTAWLAMLRNPDNQSELLFPQTLVFMLAQQAEDGSWGGETPNSLLPTMAGLLALLRLPHPTDHTRHAAKKAENYLRQALLTWAVSQHESVGFEVLAPYLLDELAKFDIKLEFPGKILLMRLFNEKLKLSGAELIYSGRSNLIHSFEAFGDNLDWERLKPLQAPNGSFGCSPAATASYLMYRWDTAAYNWLKHLLNTKGGIPSGVPNAYPIDAFEAGWVLYNLRAMGHEIPQNQLNKLTAWLSASLKADGGSISRMFGLPTDSDDTGVIMAALKHAGVPVPVDSLMGFERDGHFACFEGERGISLSANAHVLAALLTPYEMAYSSQIAKAVEYLYSVRKEEGFWDDKWHFSAYYSSASCVLALNQHPSHKVRHELLPTIQWVLQTQSDVDGGWGWGETATLEETAYAIQILKATADLVPPKFKQTHHQAIAKGTEYILQNIGEFYPDNGESLPKLWRGKELYTPVRVVFSAVLSVLDAYSR